METNISLSDSVITNMEDRGITEEDIHSVIDFAVNGSTIMYSNDDNCKVAKKRIGNFTVYVEYSLDGDKYTVTNVYSHRIKLTEDMEGEISE